MSKASLDNAIRNEVMEVVKEALIKHFETDVMQVSASEFTIAVVDAEGNEKFANLKVSIPRGTRTDGGYTPYDGYSAAEDYKAEQEEKQAKRKASEDAKAQAERERERKREARRVVKELNKKGLEKMIHEEDDNNQYLEREVSI